jgi:hypothetical protein
MRKIVAFGILLVGAWVVLWVTIVIPAKDAAQTAIDASRWSGQWMQEARNARNVVLEMRNKMERRRKQGVR